MVVWSVISLRCLPIVFLQLSLSSSPPRQIGCYYVFTLLFVCQIPHPDLFSLLLSPVWPPSLLRSVAPSCCRIRRLVSHTCPFIFSVHVSYVHSYKHTCVTRSAAHSAHAFTRVPTPASTGPEMASQSGTCRQTDLSRNGMSRNGMS